MSRFRRVDNFEPSPSLIIRETTFFSPPNLTFRSFPQVDDLGLAFDIFIPSPFPLDVSPHAPSPCELFDVLTDLIQIDRTPFSSCHKSSQAQSGSDSSLRTVCDRVSALELGFNRFLKEKTCSLDRKYSWTAEIRDAEKDRRYKWTAEIKGARKGAKLGPVVKNYKWTAEFKGKGKDAPLSRTFTFKASTAPAGDSSDTDSDSEEKRSKAKNSKRVVEIKKQADQGAIVLRHALAKRVGTNARAKTQLSPQDAALMIQMTFRAYLIHRSKALRGIRELAVAKGKLKEIRSMFNNYSYRHRIAYDAEERQRFSEKIIFLLLTVDATEGADLMIRAAKRSMLDELEAMLDVVDPQPPGKLCSMKRQKFDLPEVCIQNEIAAGVAEVVQMLNEEDNHGAALEACL